MNLGLKNKVCCITGGGSNICRATALLFAACDAKTVILDIDEDAAEKTAALANENGGNAIAIRVDVTDRKSIENACTEIESKYGGIDVWVNGVGTVRDALFLRKSREEHEKEVLVNLWSNINCMEVVLPKLLERGKGSVVTVASDAGRVGEFREAVYSACKGGVIAFMKSLAREYGPSGIRFNTVCPGVTVPESIDQTSKNTMWDSAMMKTLGTEEVQAKIAKNYPLRRTGKAMDTANAVVFIASDAASFVTGQTFSVSGGYSMM